MNILSETGLGQWLQVLSKILGGIRIWMQGLFSHGGGLRSLVLLIAMLSQQKAQVCVSVPLAKSSAPGCRHVQVQYTMIPSS